MPPGFLPTDLDFDPSVPSPSGDDWHRQLLLDTSSNPGQAAPPMVAGGPTRREVLSAIRDYGKITSDIIDLISSTVQSQRASADADARAQTSLELLQARYASSESVALGAAALRQARALIAAARTGDDLATAAGFLRRAKAVQDAMALGEGSGSTLGSDVPLLLVGAAFLGGAIWYWQRSTARRSVR